MRRAFCTAAFTLLLILMVHAGMAIAKITADDQSETEEILAAF